MTRRWSVAGQLLALQLGIIAVVLVGVGGVTPGPGPTSGWPASSGSPRRCSSPGAVKRQTLGLEPVGRGGSG